MLNQRSSSVVNNENGMAMVEIVPILALFVLLLNFAMGFFGLIHSGILNSIAARNYAFETFRNRSSLAYLRDITDSEMTFTYNRSGMRYHGIIAESRPNSVDWWVTERPIKFTEVKKGEVASRGGDAEHKLLKGISERELASDAGIEEGVNPGWVRTLYGICLHAGCGDREVRGQ